MKYMDLHIHIQDYPKDIAPEMVKKAINLGLKKFVCAGTSPKDWEKVSDIVTQYPDFVIPAFGVHPWQVSSVEPDWQQTMEKYLQKFPHALVGEIGLDNLKPEIELQKQYFSAQVKIAKKYNRPTIIHAVKSFHLFEVLWKTLPKKFMFHSFSSSVEQLQKIVSHGGYISFNQAVLKKSNFADIIKAAPENKILLESDGPYQSLNKGEFSTPLYIPELLEKIAFVKNCSKEELSEIIYNNSMEFTNVG